MKNLNPYLKFRAKNKNNKWIVAESHSELSNLFLGVWQGKYTNLCAWTGKTDKNGKDIFGGDIIYRQTISRGKKNGGLYLLIKWVEGEKHNRWNITSAKNCEVVGDYLDPKYNQYIIKKIKLKNKKPTISINKLKKLF